MLAELRFREDRAHNFRHKRQTLIVVANQLLWSTTPELIICTIEAFSSCLSPHRRRSIGTKSWPERLPARSQPGGLPYPRDRREPRRLDYIHTYIYIYIILYIELLQKNYVYTVQFCLVLSREWGNGLWGLLLGII